MAYDNKKDVLIEDLGPIPNTEMHAEVRSYDGGEEKVSIFRKVGRRGLKDKRRQLVRLSLNQAVNLGEFLTEFSSTHGTGEEPVEEPVEETVEETVDSWASVADYGSEEVVF